MTVSSTSDHKEKHTREKKTAQLVNARSRLQFGVNDFQIALTAHVLWVLECNSRQSTGASRGHSTVRPHQHGVRRRWSRMHHLPSSRGSSSLGALGVSAPRDLCDRWCLDLQVFSLTFFSHALFQVNTCLFCFLDGLTRFSVALTPRLFLFQQVLCARTVIGLDRVLCHAGRMSLFTFALLCNSVSVSSGRCWYVPFRCLRRWRPYSFL